MKRRAAGVMLLAGLVGLLFVRDVSAQDAKTPEKVTVTGRGMALQVAGPDRNGKWNPAVANAMLGVATKVKDPVTGVDTVTQWLCYVCGQAGVIVAMKGDGKTVEVTGVVSGNTITGDASDVKIIADK